MLQKLTIHNYAIIDKLEIDFSEKLNAITGETGAGKSIIVGALGLILGERADSSVLVNKEKKCIVEGSFLAENKKGVRAFLKDNELDVGEEVVVRREINTSGKSRAFINDTPVNLSQLQELSSLLVDLHQQFDTLELGDSDFQREVMDALAGNADMLQEYASIFNQWQAVSRECDTLREQKLQFDKESDYNQFQYNELEEAGFKENELEEIDNDLKLLNNAEGIKSVLNKAYFELGENENPIVQQVKSLYNQLHQYQSFHADLAPLLHRLQSTQIELQDIADEIGMINDRVQYDPEKIEALNERLSMGYRLLKKHGVQSTSELLVIQKQLEEKLQAVLNIDELIGAREKQAGQLQGQAMKIAETISKARQKQVKSFEEKVNKLLVRVGMPNARMKVEITRQPELNAYGIDRVEFLFNANLPVGETGKSGLFHPVRKVASGGELSRLMLCIKSLVAQSINLPTMIFDEIDTGISGEAARQVGIILRELATRRQVICITHQPQIAGKADAHFFVYKEVVKDHVKTSIRLLETEERITAIARMLGGEKPTAAAMENAREMVSQ